MAISTDILDRKETHFVLWRPGMTAKVVGEELSLPLDLLKQQRLDALWNDKFRVYVRAAILGEIADDASNFACTVRRLIDCRKIGFASGSQAIN